MLAAMRQAKILAEVKANGAARVVDLVALLGVSDMTIRRDIDTLVQRGLVQKVHGGATRRDPGASEEPGFEEKSARQRGEKEAIASAASELVEPGMAVGVTGGTTTWALASHLWRVPELTVVTNSLAVADVLHQHAHPGLVVVLIGGCRSPSDALVGPVATAAVRSLNFDVLFLGVHGMDTACGLTTPNILEAETNRAFLEASRRSVVVADHSKWGVVGLSHIADLRSITTVVTDDGLCDEGRRVLTQEVGDVITVSVDSGMAVG
jgi:DeoR/GlpR family transcriptional regulator of sugar metabolism